MEKLNLIAIKTDDEKYYVCPEDVVSGKLAYYNYPLDYYYFDNKKGVPTFREEWICLDSFPKTITKKVSQPNINYRFELRDKTLISEKLKEFIPREEVAYYSERDAEWFWEEDMIQYSSLYKLIWDTQEDKEEEVEFDIKVILSISKISAFTKMEYASITEKDINYQLIDKIIFPSLLLHERPCAFTSYQTYQIVRQYIRQNINPNVAIITSDYDFCFEVKRKIPLAEIKKYTVDVNNPIFSNKKRKSKFVEKTSKHTEESCFDMTYSPENYRGYTPIKGFEALNQKELKNKVDKYCKDLIDFINMPLKECTKCKGTGIILTQENQCK